MTMRIHIAKLLVLHRAPWRPISSTSSSMDLELPSYVREELNRSELERKSLSLAICRMTAELELRMERRMAMTDKEARRDVIIAMNHQMNAMNHQMNAMNHQMIAMNHQMNAMNHQMIAVNHQMIAVNHERKARDQAATLLVRSGELLKLRGCAEMRVVFGYIEEEQRVIRCDVHNLSRTQLWGRILGDREDLRNCIRHTMSAHDSKLKEEEYVVGIYKTLSAHIHYNKSPLEHAGGDAVDIVEDSLSDQQCRALDCICEAFAFPRGLHRRTNIEAWE